MSTNIRGIPANRTRISFQSPCPFDPFAVGRIGRGSIADGGGTCRHKCRKAAKQSQRID
jgi:hypothetical protein